MESGGGPDISLPQNPGGEEISESAKRGLVARILASRSFHTSSRLSAFLAHVCELSFQGRSEEIFEYQIGRAVFGRPENYDPNVDGIVRAHATRLRARLDQYFSREGRDEMLSLSIPKGGYSPVFEWREAKKETAPESSPPSPATEPFSAKGVPAAPASQALNPVTAAPAAGQKRGLFRFRHFAATALPWLLVLPLSAAVAFLAFGRLQTIRAAHLLREHPLWSQMFTPGKQTMIVPGDSALVIWQDLGGNNISLADYLVGYYHSLNALPTEELRETVNSMAHRRYTSIADLEATQLLSKVAQTQDSSLKIRYARDLTPDDLRQGNAILMGSVENDPWVQLFESSMNFVIVKNRVEHEVLLLNRKPQGQEPHSWVYRAGPGEHPSYAIVAYLSNLAGNGNVLLLEGTGIAGTECATNFVVDDRKLMPFLKRIQRADGTIPHFEVVLEANNLGGRAVSSTVLAWRLHP